ncbi:hypothetical protein OVA03_00480 [Asticcacaulis sp. SL142]|uniref:hypothetical protein n=1 Tax=Asticcacaulis sp. SL142 TaxID=2995155 RepID=UPI00226CC6FE|nr:hypothetical protein [Asticcacaulis sp. SL142]WAC48444.1 hypothetical protein OVA03_00480 [Asticcacaulis sp. SL142]
MITLKLLTEAILLLALVLSWGQWPETKTYRRQRIKALKNGAPEQYFEELRALETYPVIKAERWEYAALNIVSVSAVMCLYLMNR